MTDMQLDKNIVTTATTTTSVTTETPVAPADATAADTTPVATATPSTVTTVSTATSSSSSTSSTSAASNEPPPPTTITEAYKRHKEKRGKEVMPTEDLEIRRFLLMRAAVADDSHDLVKFLEKADKGTQLNKVLAAPKGPMVNEVMGMLSQEKKSTKLLKSFDSTVSKMRDSLVDAKRASDLKPDETVKTANGSVIPHDKLAGIVARLKGENPNLNVIIRRDPAKVQDDFMTNLRNDAKLARAFIEGGLQDEAFNDGINENTDKAVVLKFNTAIAASSAVLNNYERNRDFITRADGNHNETVACSVDEHYKMLKKNGVPFVDIRTLKGLNREALRLEMGLMAEKCTEVLVMRELLDCAIFVPRLCLLLVQQPMPRVVEYSRVMRVYQATLRILSRINKLPTHSEVKKEQTKFQKEIKKMSEEFDIKMIADPAHVEPWRSTRPTAEMVRRAFSQLTRQARDTLLESAVDLGHWYDRETRFHAGTLSDAERKLHQFEPQFSELQMKENPHLIKLKFYQEMWRNNQVFALSLLRAYEAGILLQLQRFLPKEYNDYWMSRGLYPMDIQCSDHSVNLIKKTNVSLCEWRRLLIVHASQVARGVIVPLPLPELEEGFHAINVEPQQRWSPTFGQMMNLQRAMNALFRLSKEEFQAVFSDRSETLQRVRNSLLDQQAATRAGLQEIDLGTRTIQ